MTSKEKAEFKKWNVEISINEMTTRERASVIESKYLKLNGCRSCSPDTFIYEIATTEGVKREEKIRDIMDYVKYLNGCAKAEALSDILHIYK